jgi:hypothetical protein
MPPAAILPAAPVREAPVAVNHYVIGYAPRPESAWWRFGCAWLGRDAIDGSEPAAGGAPPLEAAWRLRITAGPRRHGLRAALGPAFACAARGGYEVYLQAALLAAELAPIALPPLALSAPDGCVALEPRPTPAAFAALAARCAAAFGALRAPAPPDRQTGYAGGCDDRRFRMILTDRLGAAERARARAALEPALARLNAEPLAVDALAVFVRRGNAPFVLVRRYGFNGSVEIYHDG